MQRGVLWRVGAWDYTIVDLASGAPEYVNRVTGEVCTTVPDEVKAVTSTHGQRPVHEPTPHKFTDLKCWHQPGELCICCKGRGVDRFGLCPLCDGESSFPVELKFPAPVQRVDLWCGNSDSAFLLLNLLSPDECDDVIHQAEDMGFRDCGYQKRIRVTDRVSVMGGELVEVLFERAKPFLADVSIPWGREAPYGVPTGIFLPHHDGGFDEHDKVRSIKTFMIYLNDGFDGGCTRFYSDKQAHYRPGQPEHQIHCLTPIRGSCVVFNHHITHDGEELLGGKKYILRTEVMFQHVSPIQSGLDRSS